MTCKVFSANAAKNLHVPDKVPSMSFRPSSSAGFQTLIGNPSLRTSFLVGFNLGLVAELGLYRDLVQEIVPVAVGLEAGRRDSRWGAGPGAS
jgi:hypothetical protein